MRISEMKEDDSEIKEKNITDAYNELKDCSQEELLKKLTEHISRQKEIGAFDCDAILKMLKNVKQYIPENVYENMVRIVNNFR